MSMKKPLTRDELEALAAIGGMVAIGFLGGLVLGRVLAKPKGVAVPLDILEDARAKLAKEKSALPLATIPSDTKGTAT